MPMDVTGKRIFLSGPMTGCPNLNVAAFADAHAILKEAGAEEIYDPAVEYLMQREKADGHSHEWYMTKCVAELVRHAIPKGVNPLAIGTPCAINPKYDLLVSLPGWWDSSGACIERSVADACGIECVELSEVTAWE